MVEFLNPPKVNEGDKIAVLSPSFAAPAVAPEVHEQGMVRLQSITGLIPVEYPTTRRLGATPSARAADFNAALRDRQIRAILTTIGGDDQIRVIPHLDPQALLHDPKIFLGYSDNTNLHQWFWAHGVKSFYGGSSQVHLGPGPAVDAAHQQTLRACLLDGGLIELTDPGESEDFGPKWHDPRALTHFGERKATTPWVWAGPKRKITGRTWGGCLEVLQWILGAGRFTQPLDTLTGSVLILETSELLPSSLEIAWMLRVLGERGILGVCAAVLFARPPVQSHDELHAREISESLRQERFTAVIEVVTEYNPDAVVCLGVPFGHTRPQIIVPHGGKMIVDGTSQRIFADYS